MNIEIWTDITCPFCYMASRNFETALSRFLQREKLHITWRSFELDPDAPLHYEGNHYTMLAAKYNKTEQEIINMTHPIVEEGAATGLVFHFDTALPVNTFDAHRLLHLADHHGLQNEVREKLYAACFTEGKNISNHNVLIGVGAACGMIETEIIEMLHSDALASRVRHDEESARKLGIDGVPRFLINGKHLIKGNKKPEEYLEELMKALNKVNMWPAHEKSQRGEVWCDDGDCKVINEEVVKYPTSVRILPEGSVTPRLSK